MADAIVVDLTVGRDPVVFDREDLWAFGGDQNSRKLYAHKIWKLKQNDPNFCVLNLSSWELSGGDGICERIGVHLWQSKCIKNLQLVSCNLTGRDVEHLFGKVAQQNETIGFS